jgi:uncharacterized cupredoxin-like copper-binding protein
MNLLNTFILASLLATSSLAQAHGEAMHASRGKPVTLEQKPWGIAGDARKAVRTLDIRMGDDMRFTPALIQVRQGETLRLVIRNTGQAMHEFVLGTRQVLEEHAALMKKFPNMEHDEPYMAHVAPGQTGEIVWTFNRAGEFDFACLLPGHFDAGMVGKVRVLAQPHAGHDHGATSSATAPAGELAEGEVRRIDPTTQKLTLRHGEIRSLDMPPMTMVFTVADPALLSQLKVGDKIRFEAEQHQGRMVVTRILPAP